jgi:hypothetical protein
MDAGVDGGDADSDETDADGEDMPGDGDGDGSMDGAISDDAGQDGSLPGDGDGDGDAGVDAGGDGDGDGPCDGGPLTTFYEDLDKDGYGKTAGPTMSACEKPGLTWAEEKGDCHDDNEDVHPDQTEFFGNPYEPVDEPAGQSFDYDCDHTETAKDGQMFGPEECSALLCSGSGYRKNSSRTAGPNQNPYCGSNEKTSCTAVTCNLTVTVVSQHFECN